MTRSAVTVFGRPGCHLCELMVDELEPLCRAAGRPLRVVDVDADPAWRERYGLRVPVACLGGDELSGWPLSRECMARWLEDHAGEDRRESGPQPRLR